MGSKSAGGKLSGWLVAGEVALSTLLLVGTGLLFRTLWNLEQSRLGFETAHVTTFSAMPPDAAGFSGMAVSEDTANAPVSVAMTTYGPVLERIRKVPGMESAALATSPPLSGMNLGSSFDILGQPTDSSNKPEARVTAVSGDYARVLGTPIVRGRMIGEGDALTTPFVAVVNETLVKKYFAGKDPLGKQINLGGKDTGMIKPFTIVGVLGNQVDTDRGRGDTAADSVVAAADSNDFVVLPGAAEYRGDLRGKDTRGNSSGSGNAISLSPVGTGIRPRQFPDHARGC